MLPKTASVPPLNSRSQVSTPAPVLLHSRAGPPPFEGLSAASVLAQQITEPPEPIRRHRPDVPEEMAVVLERMMEKNRAKRFQMASEVSRALVGVMPTAARDRVRVPLRRRLRLMFYRSLVGLSIAGCLLFIAVSGGPAAAAYYVFSQPPPIQARPPPPANPPNTPPARR